MLLIATPPSVGTQRRKELTLIVLRQQTAFKIQKELRVRKGGMKNSPGKSPWTDRDRGMWQQKIRFLDVLDVLICFLFQSKLWENHKNPRGHFKRILGKKEYSTRFLGTKIKAGQRIPESFTLPKWMAFYALHRRIKHMYISWLRLPLESKSWVQIIISISIDLYAK